MTSEMGELFNELRVDGRNRRAHNRLSSLEWLRAEGFEPEVNNGGAHLVVSVSGRRFDLWPGTGKWVVDLDHKHQRHGVRGLLRELRAAALLAPKREETP